MCNIKLKKVISSFNIRRFIFKLKQFLIHSNLWNVSNQPRNVSPQRNRLDTNLISWRVKKLSFRSSRKSSPRLLNDAWGRLFLIRHNWWKIFRITQKGYLVFRLPRLTVVNQDYSNSAERVWFSFGSISLPLFVYTTASVYTSFCK